MSSSQRLAALLSAAIAVSASVAFIPVASASVPKARPAPGSYATNLSGVCPSNVVIQTNWWPEPDHALFYELVDPKKGNIDANNNTYSGPLGKTGVDVEIRAGGPAVGFQQVTSQLYQDDSITLGFVGTDEAIGNSAGHPTKAVLAWYEQSPQIFFWGNPKWNFKTVSDIKKANAPVLAFESATYLDVFEAKGLLNKSQVDTSYKGDPSKFVTEDGKVVSQGFITSEPYAYEHEVRGWDKPVKFILVREYPVYQNAVAVRSDKIKALTPCLDKLVPILQQASLDYLANPKPVNNVLLDYVGQLKSGGFSLSKGGVADAVTKIKRYKLVGNGPDGTLGSFDTARVQALIDDLKPVFESKGKAIKDGLTPADIVTNEFLDKRRRSRA